MTDPTEPGAPRDPADYRPKPLMSLGFWAMMALCVLCVLAGAAIVLLAPKLLPARPEARADAAPVEPVPLAAAPVAVPAAPAPEPPASPDVGRLTERVAALEGHEKTTATAAAAALAAAALVEASQGSGPFPQELAAARAAAPGAPELAVLQRLAESGAPSRAALADSFPDYAARAASAARAPGEGAHLADRIGYALSRVISVRRVGDAAGGDDADGLLAQAERQVSDGDIDRALRTLDRLPPKAREAMAPWRIRAERRAEIDRQAAALRARALSDLANAARGA
jgi:hypothetical protein